MRNSGTIKTKPKASYETVLLCLVLAKQNCSWRTAACREVLGLPFLFLAARLAGGEGKHRQSTSPDAVRSVSAPASLSASVAMPTPGTRTPHSHFRGRLNKGAGMPQLLVGPLGEGLTCPGTFCFLGTWSPLLLSTVCPLSTEEAGGALSPSPGPPSLASHWKWLLPGEQHDLEQDSFLQVRKVVLEETLS